MCQTSVFQTAFIIWLLEIEVEFHCLSFNLVANKHGEEGLRVAVDVVRVRLVYEDTSIVLLQIHSLLPLRFCIDKI